MIFYVQLTDMFTVGKMFCVSAILLRFLNYNACLICLKHLRRCLIVTVDELCVLNRILHAILYPVVFSFSNSCKGRPIYGTCLVECVFYKSSEVF